MIPNIPPKLFSLSAVAVGYILIDDTTALEQNALGNWLMLIAQVLCTNGFYRQVMQERGLEIPNSTESGRLRNDFFMNGNEEIDTLAMLEKMINALEKEINEIKKGNNT